MLKHYIKVAWRNLTKQKVLAFINVFGLSTGVACFLLFLLYALNEFNYDNFHKNKENIYRVYEWVKGINGGNEEASTSMPMPLAEAMKRDLPDVKEAIRIRGDFGENLIRLNKDIRRAKITFADPAIFSVFTFPILTGNANTALQGLQDLVVTEKTAIQLFGSADVVGKTVEIKMDNTFRTFTITAIAEDIPANSSIKFDILANFHFLENTEEGRGAANNWFRSMYSTFVRLKPGSKLAGNSKTLQSFRSHYYPEEATGMKKNGLSWKGEGPPIVYGLQPITTLHTDSKILDPFTIDVKTVWISLTIAFGVLLIACINFMTLAIGRSAGRSKEVGVRKVVGAEKQQLMIQFLSEALFLTLASTLLGILLANTLLPSFNQLSGRELSFSFRLYPQLPWLIAAMIVLVALLSGSYPALVLSTFKPIEVLKNKLRIGGGNLFTKAMVTLQFAVSAGLIVSTFIIVQQTRYMSSKSPGFNKDNVVLINATETDTKRIFPLFKQALSANPQIAGVTSAAIGLGEGEDFWVTGFKYKGKPVYACFNPVDLDYLNVLGMQLIAGRNFNPSIAADTVNSVIVNEEMVKEFGWTVSNAVGQTLDGFSPDKTPVVIGVVKNFHFRHAGEQIKPQMFSPFFEPSRPKFYVRLKAGQMEDALAAVQKTWSNLLPEVPLEYHFLDEKLDAFYKSEKRWSRIIGGAGAISILLACLGLLGLTSLSIVNRLKEISIRKVLGASVANIIYLISGSFLKLVMIALLIATPVSWYFMHQWLQNYAYRINMNATVFIIAGAATIAIALVTIISQVVKAGTSNPARNLKTE